MESSDQVPVQSDLPMLLDEGLRMVSERLRASPDFPLYPSIERQLEYLQQTVTRGQGADPGKIDSLTLGVYAAREFESSDPDFADVLFKVNYLANRMPMNSKPAEPDLPVQGSPIKADGSANSELVAGPPAPRRMSRARIACGVIWGIIALITAVGGVAELTVSNAGGAAVCFVVAVGSGWYDYRVWTFKARRLFLIIM